MIVFRRFLAAGLATVAFLAMGNAAFAKLDKRLPIPTDDCNGPSCIAVLAADALKLGKGVPSNMDGGSGYMVATQINPLPLQAAARTLPTTPVDAVALIFWDAHGRPRKETLWLTHDRGTYLAVCEINAGGDWESPCPFSQT